LNDYDFIATYLEKIKADFASYGVVFPELPDRDRWDEGYEFDEFIMLTNDNL
jgi:hypothetical protein